MRVYEPLTVFEIAYSNGERRTINMASGITQEEASDYFLGNWFEQHDDSLPTIQCVGVYKIGDQKP